MAVKPHPQLDGAYVIDYYPEGRKGPRVREVYTGTYEQAMKRWTELIQQHSSTYRKHTNPRINDVLAEYLEDIELHKSAGYHKSICWAFKKLKPAFGNYPVSQITEQLIRDFKKKHRDTPAHTNQCLDYLKIMINWMVRHKYALPLPFKIDKLPVTEKLPQGPDPDEFDRLLESIKANFHKSGTPQKERDIKLALVYLIYWGGDRFIEARHTRWENLREDGTCYLGRTKTGRDRFTIFPKEALDLIEPYRQKEGYIFVNPRTGNPYTSIYNLIADNAKKIGIRATGTHSLRHAMGTDSLEANRDIRSTQEILGHTTLKSTQRYTRVTTDRMKQAIEETRKYREQKRQEILERRKSTAEKKNEKK